MGTAAALRSGARWTTAIELDAGWDEFDHLGLVAAQTGQQDADMRDSRVFQTLLEAGMRAWPDNSRSVETFEAFRSRTQAALDRALGGLDKGATAVVITSAGVIGWLATALLDGGMEQWIRLNRVCVNTGVTTVVRGRSGTTLVGFNDHAHLASDHVTYR
jgi:broad specificity phosphatase PhoE